MTREQSVAYWRSVEAANAPLRVEGRGRTPRHRLVDQARLRLRVLDPQVVVWMREFTKLETGLVVCRWKRYRLAEEVARVVS
jgi:hypothetical protein